MTKQIETNRRWKYCGDRSIYYGGYYWRNDGYSDYALCVDVIDGEDLGLPSNEYVIEDGSIYISDDTARINSALDVCGTAHDTATRADIVYAVKATWGIDGANRRVLRVGPSQRDPRKSYPFAVDVAIRANASLRGYVRRTYLGYAS